MQNYGSGRAPLDVNHSHFILVDNGTAGQYGVEIPLRSRIEGAAMEQMKTLSNTSAGKLCEYDRLS